MKKITKIAIIIGIALLVIIPVTLAATIYNSEASAKAFRDSFTAYPTTKGNAKIVNMSSNLNDNYMIITWEMDVYNVRDSKNETLRHSFYVAKNINNKTRHDNLIRNRLEQEVNQSFNMYNASFIPDPKIEYVNHTLWGKIFNIKL